MPTQPDTNTAQAFEPGARIQEPYLNNLRKLRRTVVIYLVKSAGQELRVVASHDEKYLGILGGQVEKDVIAKDVMFAGEDRLRGLSLITLPLHDRNGEVVAAVRVEMKPFLGQTEKSSILRAAPIVKRMEQRFKEAKDLIE